MTNSKKVEELGWELGKELTKAEPMAVLISEKVPSDCETCILCSDEEYHLREAFICVWEYKELPEDCYNHKPDWCPFRKAIGIIEPNGYIRYF